MRLQLLSQISPPARMTLGAVLGGLLALAFLFVVAPAFAADGSTVVNVSPLVELVMELANGFLVPVLGAVAVWILTWIGRVLKAKTGIDADRAIAAMNAMLHDGIQRGVDALEGMTREKLFRDGKPVEIDLKSPAVAYVTNRLIEYSPDLLKKLGVTEERLRELALEAIRRKQQSEFVFAGVPVAAIEASTTV